MGKAASNQSHRAAAKKEELWPQQSRSIAAISVSILTPQRHDVIATSTINTSYNKSIGNVITAIPNWIFFVQCYHAATIANAMFTR